MTKSKQRLEKALARAKSLFTPIYECAEEDFRNENIQAWWTKTGIKKICRWHRKGNKNWRHLRNMLEEELGLICVPNGTPRCYTFPTSAVDSLESILAAFEVEAGLQRRTSLLTLWRSDPSKNNSLTARELKTLAGKLGKAAIETQSRLRFLAARLTEFEKLEKGDA